jgi:hypothetical protein
LGPVLTCFIESGPSHTIPLITEKTFIRIPFSINNIEYLMTFIFWSLISFFFRISERIISIWWITSFNTRSRQIMWENSGIRISFSRCSIFTFFITIISKFMIGSRIRTFGLGNSNRMTEITISREEIISQRIFNYFFSSFV